MNLLSFFKQMILKPFTLVVCLLLGTICHGQQNGDTLIEYELHAEFPGGENSLNCFIAQSFDFKKFDSLSVTGVTWAKFDIDTTGQLKNIAIAKSIDTLVDAEFLRVISLMPRWKSARILTHKIESSYNLPLVLPYKNSCRD